MRTLKVLGFLLSYPTALHQEVTGECRDIVKQERWLSGEVLDSLDTLLQALEENALLDLQEDYVALFDRTPSLSLHLFEHVHGDSRDRGQALVDLTQVYEEAGMILRAEDTPDFLPIFLEYVSTLSSEEMKEHLSSVVNILAVLGERLKTRESSYAAAFDALVEAAGKTPDVSVLQKDLKKDSGAAYDFETLDEEWKEQFAFENTPQTTGQNDGCPKAEEMLARMGANVVKERVGK